MQFLSSQQMKVLKEQPWHLLQLEHMRPSAHVPYLPNFPPHISPGPFRHTVCPQLSVVVPYVHSRVVTSDWCWPQAGGRGDPSIRPVSIRETVSTTIIILISSSIITTTYAVGCKWELTKAVRRSKGEQELVTAVAFFQSFLTVARIEECWFWWVVARENVHSKGIGDIRSNQGTKMSWSCVLSCWLSNWNGKTEEPDPGTCTVAPPHTLF